MLGFVATVPLAVDDKSAAEIPVANPVPVVLVTFDEFPVSSLMTYRTARSTPRAIPNFARTRAGGARGIRARDSANETTTQAVPAILTA